MTKNKTFAELDIPLAIVTTDIRTGEKIVISEGPVADAVRASISVPGVFRPYKYLDRFWWTGRLPNDYRKDSPRSWS
jgi:NTE family protein